MTPLDRAVAFGELPAARPTPPIASKAMKAPTAAVAPLRTLRRVAPAPPSPSVVGDVVPLLTIRRSTPPSLASAGDHHALDEHPDHRQTTQCQNVWTDARGQDTGFVLRHAWRRGDGRGRGSAVTARHGCLSGRGGGCARCGARVRGSR